MLPWRHNWSQTGLDTVSLLSSRNTSFCLNLVMEKGSVCVLTLDSVVDLCGSKPSTQGRWKCFSEELLNALLIEFNNKLIPKAAISVSMETGPQYVFIECDSCFCMQIKCTKTEVSKASKLLKLRGHTHSFSSYMINSIHHRAVKITQKGCFLLIFLYYTDKYSFLKKNTSST